MGRSMPRYVAFLRAVNVGGRTVKMDELRAHVAAAGGHDVETFIASGNVIFSSSVKAAATLEQTIEAHLEKALGFDVPTLIRTTEEVAEAAARTPYPETDVAAAGTYVAAFLRRPLDAAGKKGLASLESDVDRFVLQGREVYWLAKTKQSETKLTIVKFERAVGCAATMRAMTSLQKLAAKHCG